MKKMQYSRHDYEHQELDNDGCYYWFMNRDVNYLFNVPELQPILDYWRSHEVNQGLYYKGTRLYFTFKGIKYYLSWTFYSKSLIDTTVKKLRVSGAENIQINYGELD